MKKQSIKTRFGIFLVKLGTRLMGFHEVYGKDDYAVTDGIMCACCRNCGSPTQTTDSICWRCRK